MTRRGPTRCDEATPKRGHSPPTSVADSGRLAVRDAGADDDRRSARGYNAPCQIGRSPDSPSPSSRVGSAAARARPPRAAGCSAAGRARRSCRRGSPGVAAAAWAAGARPRAPAGVARGRAREAADGTVKDAIALGAATVETVLIPGRRPQHGLRLEPGRLHAHCRFCATATLGFAGRSARARSCCSTRWPGGSARRRSARPQRGLHGHGRADGQPRRGPRRDRRLTERARSGLSPRTSRSRPPGSLPGMKRFLRERRAHLALSLNAHHRCPAPADDPPEPAWPIAACSGALRDDQARRVPGGARSSSTCSGRRERQRRRRGAAGRAAPGLGAQVNLIPHNGSPGPGSTRRTGRRGAPGFQSRAHRGGRARHGALAARAATLRPPAASSPCPVSARARPRRLTARRSTGLAASIACLRGHEFQAANGERRQQAGEEGEHRRRQHGHAIGWCCTEPQISHAPEARTEFESGRIVAPDDGPSWVLLARIALLARTAAKGGAIAGPSWRPDSEPVTERRNRL